MHLYTTKSWKSLVFYPLTAFAEDPGSVPNTYVVAHSQRTQGLFLVFRPFPSPGSLHPFSMFCSTDMHICLFLRPPESLHLLVLCVFPKICVDARHAGRVSVGGWVDACAYRADPTLSWGSLALVWGSHWWKFPGAPVLSLAIWSSAFGLSCNLRVWGKGTMWYPVTQMDQRRTLEESLRPVLLSLKRSYLPDLGVGWCNMALALLRL